MPTPEKIRFEDAAAYERMMGVWSRLAGAIFVEWLQPEPGMRWIDVGCGSGIFTELIAERCAPAEIQGIDPSQAQLAFARERHKAGVAHFRQGDAGALPFPDDRFDIAVMALVLFFVPDPGQAVAELVRVVRPGGMVAAYVWDMLGGGFPLEMLRAELRALGAKLMHPPSEDASRMEALRDLWTTNGLEAVETRHIDVQRTFASFEDYWSIAMLSPSLGPTVAALPSDQVELIKARMRTQLKAEGGGCVTSGARANAIKGRVPACGTSR
jgi:ubiquinone/menaquinone biosynthesis C-methylase UbiE